MSLVNVLCCQAEVSATGRSPVRRSLIKCGVSECVSHSTKNSARYYHKCTYIFTLSVRYPCQMLKKFVFFPYRVSNSRQILNFNRIRSVAAELFHTDGQTDRHDEANSRYSEFCERSYKRLFPCTNSTTCFIQGYRKRWTGFETALT